MQKLSLKPAQVPMVDWLRAHKRCALWAGMGIGKSSATLFAHDVLRVCGELSDPTLVICPARVARDVWPVEITKWRQFQALKLAHIGGTPAQRATLLTAKMLATHQYFTISYELLPWLVEHFMAKWPFKTVVADESDRLKGFRTSRGGQRAHAIARVAHSLTDRWVNLTGTPSPHGLTDLWGQTWYLDRGARLGRTYTAFVERWFKPRWSGFGIDPLPFAEEQIHAALQDICLTVDPRDYFDLREPIVTQVKVKLPPAARKLYAQLEKDMFMQLGDATVQAFNAAALTNKCLQLANGAVYTTAPEWKEVHDAKLQALESIIAESGGAGILVSYQFRSDRDRIIRAIGQTRVGDLATARGMAAFRKGCVHIGLAHPKSLGHGIDGLQDCANILVRFGRGWNYGEELQMLERIGPMRQLQSGHDRAVFVYDLVAEDTLDEDVILSHTSKRTVQDALLGAMKRRG